MPIYEYACEKCGHEVDVLQKIGDGPPSKCEKCGAKGKMKRRVSKTSFVLKGGGWGADLYGNKKGSSTTATPASSESKSTTSTTTTTSTTASSTTTTTSTPAPKPSTDKK